MAKSDIDRWIKSRLLHLNGGRSRGTMLTGAGFMGDVQTQALPRNSPPQLFLVARSSEESARIAARLRPSRYATRHERRGPASSTSASPLEDKVGSGIT